MKTSHSAALTAAFAAASVFAAPRAEAGNTTSPSVPVGTLTTNQSVVRSGTNPLLQWNITYPSVVTDHVTITNETTVTPKNPLSVQIRVLGAGVTTSSGGSGFTYVPTEAQLKVGSGSYQRIFYGTNKEVNPTKVVYSATLATGQALRFGGRYYYDKSWGPTYTSDSGFSSKNASGPNVRILTNGQIPPKVLPASNAPSLESFLRPYLDATGKVNIGPMDMIVFMELTDTSEKDSGYDLQDMVLLVTCKTVN